MGHIYVGGKQMIVTDGDRYVPCMGREATLSLRPLVAIFSRAVWVEMRHRVLGNWLHWHQLLLTPRFLGLQLAPAHAQRTGDTPGPPC